MCIRDRLADLALRFRHSTNGLYIRTKLGTSAGSFTEKEFRAGDGSGVDIKEALSGSTWWNGGATFPRVPKNCSPSGCTTTQAVNEIAVKNLGNGISAGSVAGTLKKDPAVEPRIKIPVELKPLKASPLLGKSGH